MKQKLQIAAIMIVALLFLKAEHAQAQFFPHNDTSFTFVSTTNVFGRIQTYDGADGRYEDAKDKMIDRLYQVVGLSVSYVWNPNDDPDVNLLDTLYYAGTDSSEYFRELVLDNSYRNNPPVDINVTTLVRMFKDENFGIAQFGVVNVEDENQEYLLSVMVRTKIHEVFGGESFEWNEAEGRAYLFTDAGAVGLQPLSKRAVGVSFVDFSEYDSTDPARDNARDFARWAQVEKTTFPTSNVTAGANGGYGYINFGSTGDLAKDEHNYVWIAFTHGADLDEVDARLDDAVEKAIEIGIEIPSSVTDDRNNNLPTNLVLSQNYPNPFNPTTNISFTLPLSGMATLKMYDMLGREVAVLANGAFSAGEHTFTVDASNLTSGAYMYRLEMNGVALIRIMTLIK